MLSRKTGLSGAPAFGDPMEFFDLGPAKGRPVFVLSAPYEGTASFGKGTAAGPKALFAASLQIESFDPELGCDLAELAHFLPKPPVSGQGSPEDVHARLAAQLDSLNAQTDFLLTLGGEHSIPLPLFAFYKRAFPDLAILHVDAHADLRESYQDSQHSHACIMARALELGIPLFQIGIRSFCTEQHARMQTLSRKHLQTLFAWDLPEPREAARKLKSWLGTRPLYLSFDVDGMDPSVIPGTGTPEPGGITYPWIMEFWKALWAQDDGPVLVGMDMCELAPIPGEQVSEAAAVKILQRICTAYFSAKKFPTKPE